jgi:hypothetical protein
MIEGRNLGVRAIVAGEFIRRDNDLLLHVELVDVADGTQLWGAQASCSSSQVLKVSDEIADEILQQLHPILSRGGAKAQPKLLEPFSAGASNANVLAPAVGQSAASGSLKRFTGS